MKMKQVWGLRKKLLCWSQLGIVIKLVCQINVTMKYDTLLLLVA